MKKLIDNTVSWDTISRSGVDKSEYRYTLGEARFNTETGLLSIPVKLNFIIPYSDVRRLESQIKSKADAFREVEFEFEYENMVLSTEDIVRLFLPHMAHILNGPYALFTKAIFTDRFSIDGKKLIITAVGETSVGQLNENVKHEYERMLKTYFGLDFDIEFENDVKTCKEREQDFLAGEAEDYRASMNEYAKKLKQAGAMKSSLRDEKQVGDGFKSAGSESGERKGWGKRKKKELPAEGNRIMGSGIHAPKNAELKDLEPSMHVIVEGTVFKKESRIIKSGNYLASLLITDNKTTVLAKSFVSDEKWKEIDSLLKSGDMIKMEGDVQFDTWENMNVIMFSGIEKMDRAPGRPDTCETGKRVELHIHSKMSTMDGLNEPADIVRQAAEWGHPAVAITDHGVVQAFPDAAKEAGKQAKEGRPIKIIYGVEGYVFDDTDCINPDGSIDYKSKPVNHIIILAKDQAGLKNIYKLVSYSHLNYFYRKPRLPWSVIEANREGLIIGSACSYGEVFQSVVKQVYFDKKHKREVVLEQKSPDEQERIASRYDYLEIQPIINNSFMLDEEFYLDGKRIETEDDLREINKRIIALADRLGKPVVATTDSHYGEPDDAIYRNILMAGMGFEDAENGAGLYMKTTDEMLREFSYLGDRAEEVVITNTNRIADMCQDDIAPVPKTGGTNGRGKFPPKIEGAEETLRNSCLNTAYAKYGNPLPPEIEERLMKELNSVIDNGYAVMYVSAQMLVQKSLSDGYLVGSRGSVGSSFAATMAGITEVNPLDPHYICPECHHLEWGDKQVYDCGIDMPPKDCPECGTPMKRDGFTIPFATFLGFDGDKEPDIDLNFAGEYQPVAHRYVGEIFGEKNVFKAGTVGTVAEKTAYGYVAKFFEERQIPVNKYEIDRLTQHCTGVKRTTGQHPGGIVICPDDHEIFEFCPVQHPANDTNTDIITTHFDYHKIDENLLKLDILGHDIPQMIRQLQDMTGVEPLNIDLTDRKVLSIFNGIEALDIKDPDYKFTHGTYAIPEFGTPFVRQMLDDIHPGKFEDLVRMSGFSHGTDVWLNNAQDYIRSGVATMREVISTRDDIMNYLMLKGIENKTSFKIMEDVRKNRPLKDEQLAVMKEHGVPDWYIDSCIKIQYMFPRAHAVAYVMMSFRMAWFKVYYPAEFYATYFTTKVANFDEKSVLKGKDAVLTRMEEIDQKGNNASPKEKDDYIILEVAYEMYARGLEFMPACLGKSDGTKFRVEDGKVLLPFLAIEGVGETAAKAFAEEYEKKPFDTVEEAIKRAKLNKTVVEGMREHGLFRGMPETDQLSFL